MSDTKRTKREAATAEDAEEDQAAVVGDDEEVPLEGDADALGDLTGAEEAYEYDEEENEFLAALADVQDKLSEVRTVSLGLLSIVHLHLKRLCQPRAGCVECEYTSYTYGKVLTFTEGPEPCTVLPSACSSLRCSCFTGERRGQRQSAAD